MMVKLPKQPLRPTPEEPHQFQPCFCAGFSGAAMAEDVPIPHAVLEGMACWHAFTVSALPPPC